MSVSTRRPFVGACCRTPAHVEKRKTHVEVYRGKPAPAQPTRSRDQRPETRNPSTTATPCAPKLHPIPIPACFSRLIGFSPVALVPGGPNAGRCRGTCRNIEPGGHGGTAATPDCRYPRDWLAPAVWPAGDAGTSALLQERGHPRHYRWGADIRLTRSLGEACSVSPWFQPGAIASGGNGRIAMRRYKGFR